MKITAVIGRSGPALLLAGLVVSGLAGCENGPDLEKLAPTMPKFSTEVPETRHPETKQSQYPNINLAPDRESVMHSDTELKEIEKSLEAEGDAHVKEAVTEITGKPPEKGKKAKGSGKDGDKAKKKAAEDPNAEKPDAASPGGPIQLSPPPTDQPS